jgi:2-oxoglutarate ferredoxin oxidoreductase subunit gamma
MIERLIIAGFGGQGSLTSGRLLAQCAIRRELRVSYLPAYGSEVRGGTAHCNLVISDAEICSPVVEHADSLVMLNEQSLARFRPELKPGGLLVANTSLIDQYALRPAAEGVRVLEIDATNLAAGLGSIVVANMVMMGAWLTAIPIFEVEAFDEVLQETLGRRKAELIETNRQALRTGAREAARQLAET